MIAAKTPSLVRSRTTCSSTAPRAPLILCRADPDKAARDNRSTQLNPNNPNYGGGSTDYKGKGDRADLDNHSRQMNPNDPAYQGNKGGGSQQKK